MAAIGVRGHDFGPATAHDLADRIASAGFSLVQLAPAKALLDYPLSPDHEAERAFATSTASTFARVGLAVAALGCVIDTLHPDPERRKSERERFQRAISLCDAYAAPMVATETGKRSMDGRGYAELLDAFSRWAGMAREKGVSIAIEPAFGHAIPDPWTTKRLLDDIGSPSVGIVYDPANLVDPADPGGQAALFALAFELLGDRILVVHAKDFTLSEGRKSTTVPGRGAMDWKAALDGYAYLPHKPPIIIEDQRPLDYGPAASFLESVLQDA